MFRSQQVWNVAPYALIAHFPIKIGAVLFIVKWEICSNYCNSIVGKISRAWLIFFFFLLAKKINPAKKKHNFNSYSSLPGELCPGHDSSQSHSHHQEVARCVRSSMYRNGATCNCHWEKKDRFPELLTKRPTWEGECIVWYAGRCFPQKNTFEEAVT